MKNRFGIIIVCFAAAILTHGDAKAETQQYCVVCKGPDQTYLCRVETPLANPNNKGLELYCIIRTSKDGGHKSCAVDTRSAADCAGPVKTYTFQAPTIPPNLRSAVERYRNRPKKAEEEQSLPPQKGGEPKTLVDVTGRAVDASREGLRNTVRQ
jgi:hypothetical protein